MVGTRKSLEEETKCGELLLQAFIDDEQTVVSWHQNQNQNQNNRATLVESFKGYNELLGEPYRTYTHMETVNDMGLPVLLGLAEDGEPYFIDLETSPINHILGGTGSCKDWLTYSLMYNLLTTNTPNDLQFLILDVQHKPIWQKFSKAPHVLGYHTVVSDYSSIIRELINESTRRKQILADLGKSDWKYLRKELQDQGNFDELKKYPNIVVVIDELTQTMATLCNRDSREDVTELRGMLETLAILLGDVGIQLITLGDRPVVSSLPKELKERATLKVAFRLNAVMDLKTLFGVELESPEPNTMYVEVAGKEGLATIRSIQMCDSDLIRLRKQVRVIGLAWTRRTIGNGIDYTKVTDGMEGTLIKSFNRADNYKQSLMDMERGYILTNKERSIEVPIVVNPEKVSEPIKESIAVETIVKDKADLLTRLKSLFSRNKRKRSVY